MYDVIIIGAGVTGCAIARELSKYPLRSAVVERAADVCEGTSKANSGIVHAGYDAKPGTCKAKLNIRGNRMMKKLSEELDFPYRQNGSLVLCFRDEDRGMLADLADRGIRNGVEGLRVIEAEELRRLESGISEQAVAALYAPSGGIVCPFGLTIAMAENACENGVEFFLETEVFAVSKKPDDTYCLNTSNGEMKSRIVINAAGVYADKFHNMVSETKIHIIPRKGEYCLFDRTEGSLISHTVFQLPTKYGKGVLVTPTVHGNLMAGPTAEDTEDKEGVNTTASGLKDVMERGALSVKRLSFGKIITSFAGLRAHLDAGNGTGKEYNTDDFIIEEVQDAKGFIDVAGIESPGLTCAPAIGEYVAELVLGIMPSVKKKDFKSCRRGIVQMSEADEDQRKRLIQENSAYANVICRCEMVTEGEILAAIHRPLGASSMDGVKRRTRAGMGRCQSGFCSPKIAEILARELGKDMGEITKAGGDSSILIGFNGNGGRNG